MTSFIIHTYNQSVIQNVFINIKGDMVKKEFPDKSDNVST